MENNITKIVNYLAKNGPMSGRDICADLEINPWDVEEVAQNGAIRRTTPMHGGVSPWFVACQITNSQGGGSDTNTDECMMSNVSVTLL